MIIESAYREGAALNQLIKEHAEKWANTFSFNNDLQPAHTDIQLVYTISLSKLEEDLKSIITMISGSEVGKYDEIYSYCLKAWKWHANHSLSEDWVCITNNEVCVYRLSSNAAENAAEPVLV